MRALYKARLGCTEKFNYKEQRYSDFVRGVGKFTMKVRASIKADPSKGDKIVRRRGRVYVINKTDPNRKQRQKGPARKK